MMTGMPPQMMPGNAREAPQAGVGQGGAPDDGGLIAENLQQEPEITGGRGYRAAAREINGQA
jgi:hypothetical protein